MNAALLTSGLVLGINGYARVKNARVTPKTDQMYIHNFKIEENVYAGILCLAGCVLSVPTAIAGSVAATQRNCFMVFMSAFCSLCVAATCFAGGYFILIDD